MVSTQLYACVSYLGDMLTFYHHIAAAARLPVRVMGVEKGRCQFLFCRDYDLWEIHFHSLKKL